MRELLTGVVAWHSGIPHLPVDVRPPFPQQMFEQLRIRIACAVAERHRVAENQNAKGAQRLRELIIAVVAKTKVVDPQRDSGEPARVIRREPLTADRIGEKE